VNDSDDPGLDTAVIAVDGGVLRHICIGEAVGLLFGNENLNVLAQRSLIAFQRQDIIGFLFNDLLRDISLAPHRIDGHDRAFDGKHIEQLRDRYDLIGFFCHLDLAEHKALTGSKG
jgi:hypothetical protein